MSMLPRRNLGNPNNVGVTTATLSTIAHTETKVNIDSIRMLCGALQIGSQISDPEGTLGVLTHVSDELYIRTISSGGGSGAISVPNDHFFMSEAERDLFFAGDIEEDTYCVIGTTPPTLQRYQDGDWIDITAVVQGQKGEPGPSGEPGQPGRDGTDGIDGGIEEAPDDGKQYDYIGCLYPVCGGEVFCYFVQALHYFALHNPKVSFAFAGEHYSRNNVGAVGSLGV